MKWTKGFVSAAMLLLLGGCGELKKFGQEAHEANINFGNFQRNDADDVAEVFHDARDNIVPEIREMGAVVIDEANIALEEAMTRTLGAGERLIDAKLEAA